MSSGPRTASFAALLVAGSTVLLLSGCGGSAPETPTAPANPTDAELTAWASSADSDAKSIAEAAMAKFKADKAFPSSADGLGTLSEGNRVGKYESSAQYAKVCVEHVRDGKAWVANTYYLGVDGRVDPFGTSKNLGCV